MIDLEFKGTKWVEHGVVYHDAKYGRPERAFKYAEGDYIMTSSDAYVTRENPSLIAKLYYDRNGKTYDVEIGSLVRQILADNSCWVSRITKNLRDAINKLLFEDPFYPVESKKDGCPQGMMRLHKMKKVVWEAVYLYNLKVSVIRWKKGEEHEPGQTRLEFFDGVSRFTKVINESINFRKNDKLDLLQVKGWLGQEYFDEKFPFEDDLIAQKMN